MSLLRQFQPTATTISPAAVQFQQAIDALPDPHADPKAYRAALTKLNENFADFLRLQTQVQLVELSQQDPDEFMRVMPKILDNFIPKMKSVEAKVDQVIDHRIYVETAYREPVPIEQLKAAGVVIESEAEQAAEISAPDAQSPVSAGYSLTPPSAPLTPSPSPASIAALRAAVSQPTSRALLSLVTTPDDDDFILS